MGSYTRVTMRRNAKYVRKSTPPDTMSAAPARMVVAMPSLRNACPDEIVTPVASSEATCARSNAPSLPRSSPRNAPARFVARISRAQSRYSCTPSIISRRRASFAAILRLENPLVAAMIAAATGSGQNAASPSRQSKAITPTMTMTLDMPVPNSCGTTCMNNRS